MATDKQLQRLRAKLGIPNPKPKQLQKPKASLQIQPARKGCCGR